MQHRQAITNYFTSFMDNDKSAYEEMWLTSDHGGFNRIFDNPNSDKLDLGTLPKNINKNLFNILSSSDKEFDAWSKSLPRDSLESSNALFFSLCERRRVDFPVIDAAIEKFILDAEHVILNENKEIQLWLKNAIGKAENGNYWYDEACKQCAKNENRSIASATHLINSELLSAYTLILVQTLASCAADPNVFNENKTFRLSTYVSKAMLAFNNISWFLSAFQELLMSNLQKYEFIPSAETKKEIINYMLDKLAPLYRKYRLTNEEGLEILFATVKLLKAKYPRVDDFQDKHRSLINFVIKRLAVEKDFVCQYAGAKEGMLLIRNPNAKLNDWEKALKKKFEKLDAEYHGKEMAASFLKNYKKSTGQPNIKPLKLTFINVLQSFWSDFKAMAGNFVGHLLWKDRPKKSHSNGMPKKVSNNINTTAAILQVAKVEDPVLIEYPAHGIANDNNSASASTSSSSMNSPVSTPESTPPQSRRSSVGSGDEIKIINNGKNDGSSHFIAASDKFPTLRKM